MNHKYWISILLDETLSDERIMKLIDISYQLTDKKDKKKDGTVCFIKCMPFVHAFGGSGSYETD